MFKASNGWYFKLKQKFDLSSKRIIGEAQSADYKASSDFQRFFHDILKDYEIRNIFHLDETGLFWKLLPDRLIILSGKEISGLN